MGSILKWVFPLMIIGSVFLLGNVSSTKDDYKRCELAVNKWATSQLSQPVDNKHTLRDLLFFLHVPRTGGRTYFHCFLKKLYASHLECPRSYDKLRFNPRKAHCRLLVTHDDYSMMTKLPKEKTSVVTILRNPVDRVFSTYEFSIEVAARFLVHPNLTSATQMAGRIRKKNNVVSTLDIWPWKYLVPWMREDLFSRRDARLGDNLNHVVGENSYNMQDYAMPLHQYIKDPIALDIVHNGATFQVAGLTNNSNLAESHEVRTCVQKYHSLGTSVLEVAKRRLDNMLYVGLTEDHKGSATTFAHVVGAQVISQLVGLNSSTEYQANNITEESSSLSEFESQKGQHKSIPNPIVNNPGTVSPVFGKTKKSMTVGELMKAYEGCITNLRKSQSQRRINSLKRISPVNYTKEARHQVPQSVIEQIISLNRLDMELYKYAQNIFDRQHAQTVQKLEGQDSILMNAFGEKPCENMFLIMAIVSAVLVVLLYVNARRRMFKVKV
ncbi:protein-tyrosine sulfotransferase [Amaranthus tricolor]|uniref:protein-tyrosine sulfotransferase n=1 Tax=Amaranthus tricolor TaxID=29722 RepID=UPI00258FF9E1|nr:protein-tyrosine sulfotransferase [Amaranthus tricolor]XP_057526850.1 protein-tyrosine sulfotransferase [Amaranthus tricolor]XP_057526851.1 protein-tyrosine sulfotransferase [Amaranthus tricolor]XP_057526852.1 protein-tyrosine sulfotransferase [Amaranthus tricolor]